eukprot:TRINITY_DN21459_c0_g1_i2.p1 TRINITY_DN21459_c0_g1~~TRINITY_DN21459_c0_g1_i2.p1  ORF type:complete len:874 (-),score=144.54 TRINITY_DN21459_c0_g1_i2:19-2517(-)
MTDAETIMESSLEDAVRDCILNDGDAGDLVKLLDKKANPNCALRYKLGPKSFDGTPLTLAVKKDRLEIAKLLLDRKADPQSKYSMKVGKLAVQWEGPAVCGAMFPGNLTMIRLLVEYDAEVTGQVISFDGEPNSTCLYEACYFGHAHVVRYLIAHKCELDVAVMFQDDKNIRFTPLHIACKSGRHEVVQALLQAGARVPAAQEWGPAPLKDAIDGCHVETVRLLVENSADLFTGERRGMDYLMKVNNRVLLAAAANGLYYAAQKSEKAIVNIRIEDFIHFLGIENAEKIVSAIFIKREIRYWKDGKRDVWKSAYVDDDMNVAIGPAFNFLENKFQSTMTRASETKDLGVDDEFTAEVEAFMEQLLPNRWRLSASAGECQVPVEIYQCVLPNIHHNVDVLKAIAAGSNREIFEEHGCKAIINVGFNQSMWTQKVTLSLDTLFATLFILLASCLDKASPLRKAGEWPRHVFLSICLIIWIRNWVRELLQFLGSTYNGSCLEYFQNLDNWMDLTRMTLTGASLLSMAVDWKGYEDGRVDYQLTFAIAGMFRWVKLLGTLKGFQSTGKPMLPILNAIPDTAPFLLVCICYMLAFYHAFYSFNVTDGYASALNIYRLGFLGDFEMTDFGVPEVANGDVQTYKWYINLLFLAVSFSFTVCFLNILVGVLGESYNRGWERREQLFHLERARLSLQHFAISDAWNRMFCRRRLTQVLPYKKDGPEEEDSRMDYVWFCQVRDSPDMTEDDGNETDQNVHEKINDLRRDIKNLTQMTRQPSSQDFERTRSVGSADVEARLDGLEKISAELLEGLKAIQSALSDQRTQPKSSPIEHQKTAESL